MSEYANRIIEELKAKRNKDKAIWLENYVKHNVKSLGVGIPVIREVIKYFVRETQFNESPIKQQIEFLNDLMADEYTEPKLAAILFVQLYWKTNNTDNLLNVISNWFDRGDISDWNVCDWLCVRILTPILDKAPELAISEFREWNKNGDIWKARASLVPFAQSKTIVNHIEIIVDFSTVLIRREERFCKTAVGWVLREYSKVDKELVIYFLEKNKEWTTKEVEKNAMKYIGKQKARTANNKYT